jgi:exodeoxyribonuclease VII small subunit
MEEQSYSQAIEELENIVMEIENEDISVDELSEKVKRAAELIRICKAVLYKTEEEVNAVLKGMREEQPPEG